MAKQPVNGQVMLAVSWFLAFNILAVRGTQSPLPERKIDWLIMAGIEDHRPFVWENLKRIITSNDDPIKAKTEIISFIKKNKDRLFYQRRNDIEKTKTVALYECNRQIDGLEKECSNGESWLSSPEKYRIIKEYILNGRVIVKTLDLFDPQCTANMAAALAKRELFFDVMYHSNLASFAQFDQGLYRYRQATINLITRTSLQTLFICCSLISKEDYENNRATIVDLKTIRNLSPDNIETVIPYRDRNPLQSYS